MFIRGGLSLSYTLYLTPSTQSLKPYTLHLIPYTVYLTPYTLYLCYLATQSRSVILEKP